MDRGCRQRSKKEYLEADDGISSKALVGGAPTTKSLAPTAADSR